MNPNYWIWDPKFWKLLGKLTVLQSTSWLKHFTDVDSKNHINYLLRSQNIKAGHQSCTDHSRCASSLLQVRSSCAYQEPIGQCPEGPWSPWSPWTLQGRSAQWKKQVVKLLNGEQVRLVLVTCYHFELVPQMLKISAIHSSAISYFNVSASGGAGHFLDDGFFLK